MFELCWGNYSLIYFACCCCFLSLFAVWFTVESVSCIATSVMATGNKHPLESEEVEKELYASEFNQGLAGIYLEFVHN